MTRKPNYTHFAGFCAFMTSMICSWLFFSIIAWLFADHSSYYEVLREPGQAIAAMFLYWWCPGMFIMADMYDWDDSN